MDSTRTLTGTAMDTGTAGTPTAILTKGSAGRKKRLRVAGYARVSTDLVEQEGSIELQIRTLHDQIKANPDYELAGIFADDGLTGTQADKRPQLMDLIKACEEGKVDRIITKSLSRFARNTLDTLTYLDRLKELGVTIFFQKENIDTAAAYSDMLLTIMAAFSQEESRSISENVKWGIRKRYEQGIARWSRLYGYGKEGETEYVIIPEEAAVVRRIFNEAEMNKGTKEIARKLNEDKLPTKDGAKKGWSASVVASLLHNERYKGCILLQKSYTEDHLTHHVVKNDFKDIPAYSIENHHEGIVDVERFANGEGYKAIADALNSKGARRLRSDKPFNVSCIQRMVRNETYVGDKKLQKQAPQDYLTKKPKAVTYESYYLHSDHEGIIERDVWEKAKARVEQMEKDAKDGIRREGKDHHAFYGHLFCAQCGQPYRRRVFTSAGEKYCAWNCRERQKGKNGNGCKNKIWKEEVLTKAVCDMLGWDDFDEKRFEESGVDLQIEGNMLSIRTA